MVFSEERSSSEFPSCFVDFGVTIFALVEILVSCDLNFFVNINVTAKEIADALNKQFSLNVDKRKLTVPDIKELGSYNFEVKLYQGISAKLFVMVGE